ncbi:MAG: putative ferredoxin-like protein YdhY [Dehalococcoidia bacterium]|nr:putative ferredoxin-like protein YdhY [Bacillota bacterium]
MSGKILQAKGMNRCIACYSCMLACARVVYKTFSPRYSAIQIRTRGGMQSRLAADICRGCLDAPCATACPTEAILPRIGGGVKFNRKKCVGCGACAQKCVVQVIYFDEQERRPVICIQCGICVGFCPHEVLSMEVRQND